MTSLVDATEVQPALSGAGPDGGIVPDVLPHASTVLVDGKTVVYDEDEHSMLVLNSSAGEVWRRCNGVTPLDDIADELAAAHGAERALVFDDAWRTVCKLAGLGLVADARTAPSS
jgi:hypothetical protein